MLNKIFSVFMAVVVIFTSSCETSKEQTDSGFSIESEKYTLANGLDVVLHQDKSDPVVSVGILYHVGSNREKPGRTGFAHLFEHMLFQESENVPQDQFFKIVQNVGGTLNGFTWKDGTMYFEIVPKNALETMLWLESDRLGFLLNTVTESAFANQQEVVQNEKRQRVDNRPYGHTNYVIDKNMYPEGHPYNWQVIGELVDLQSATVADVKEFYNQFYGPNNATLVIAGDFENAEVKPLVEKYFGPIGKRGEVAEMEPQPVKLDASKRFYHEDNFATAPQLNMVWPTVEEYSKDAYALDFLAEILSDGKKAPLYKVLVKEKNFTSSVAAWNRSQELAGSLRISINANQGIPLDSVEAGISKAFELFETEGVKDSDVAQVKAKIETEFYDGISSVFNKTFQLAYYNTFARDPQFIEKDIANIQAVTKEDVLRVYNTYLKGKPYILTSFVPKGQMNLSASNCEKAAVVEEVVQEMVAENNEAAVVEEVIKSETTFDRTVAPEIGSMPELTIPTQWNTTLENGLAVYGIEQKELPLVNASLVIKGGHLMDDLDKIGVANLMTDIMNEGTANKTPQELEEAIALLGAEIGMFTSEDAITFTVNSLARNFPAAMALLEEILLEPRWDEDEFTLIKTRTVNIIKRRDGDPGAVTGKVYKKLLYGTENIRGYSTSGTAEDVENITIDDLKAFYDNNFSPTISTFHVVGDISQADAQKVLSGLETRWKAKEVEIPTYEAPANPEKPSLYFVDFPDAKQSVINIGYLSMSRPDPDFYPATVMNYKLGGSFSGNVNLILREEKGYTYGARTNFSGDETTGEYTASSSVRTNTTFESVKIFKEEMEKYREGVSEEDLEFTKNALIKSNARRFETLGALRGMIETRSKYGFAPDYIKDEENVVRNMTLDEHKALAQKYITPDQMIYLVSGDAKTQLEQFKNTGFDQVILLDKEGNEVKEPINLVK
ncbi:zinc protease [Reichenbachiella faecimaris]|uniref:Zinc protease n=1 Tax=Reichenbachiella faecimaris TaxID=692418 RepID=A0A1W2GPI4_REIFA|nr:pitrilysin family protein [Reichenbachiella faecimaris]SMD38186.1 zinc protease [Reichenbachiella faecimaris]